jgi:hypothetical protein
VDLALTTPAPPGGAGRLAEVRDWWHEHRPGPTIGQRLDLVYTVVISIAILGTLAYGTASSALAQVLTPDWLEQFGPSIALVALLVTARWGAYQGPVVFSVADVAHMLGAPLPRRGLAIRRLVLGLATGALAGAVVAALALVGLGGEGRGVEGARIGGLVAGLAALGVLAVAAAWTVERSARWDRASARAIWPVTAVAVALALVAGAGAGGRAVAVWSGPWGWAVQAGTGAGTAQWLAALALLVVTTAAAATAVLRGCGDCPAERHLRRAEARASAVAALTSWDARSARRAFESAGPGRAVRGGGNLRALRALAERLGRPGEPSTAAIVWRNAVAARRSPGRVLEAVALAGAGGALALTNADRTVAVLAAMLLVYFGAARVMAPLRAELDVPGRARILLRAGLGRVLVAHAIVPAVVAAVAAALAAAVCAAAGGLPAHGGAAALTVVLVAPAVSCCAAMSARRGGRLPTTVFASATALDPSGGGFSVVMWLAAWPAAGAVIGAVPVLVATHSGPGSGLLAALVALAAGGILLSWLRERPELD